MSHALIHTRVDSTNLHTPRLCVASQLVTCLGVCFVHNTGALFTLGLRTTWPRVFSSDASVLDLASATLPILYLYSFWDATKCCAMGILRGAGRPGITVYGNTLACILVGFPLAYLLTFVQTTGLWGLWGAMSTAWFAATTVYAIVIFRYTDWDEEVANAQARNRAAAITRTAKEGVATLHDVTDLPLKLDGSDDGEEQITAGGSAIGGAQDMDRELELEMARLRRVPESAFSIDDAVSPHDELP
jgi:hypothetical protein